MISRRFLRVKVLQTLYSFYQEGPGSVSTGEKQLLSSLDKLNELYIQQLSLLVEVRDFAERRIHERMQKYLPTPEDLNPNPQFVENPFIAQIAENKEFLSLVNRYKISWGDELDLVKKLYAQFEELDEFKSYMNLENPTYKDHKQISEVLFFAVFLKSEILESFFEEKNIYGADNFDLSFLMLSNTIKAFKASWDASQPLPALHDDATEESESMSFLLELYRQTILHDSEWSDLISPKTKNWDFDRIALIDMILLKMALTELIYFPSIPVKVTMNEYIELSKHFSTPRSKLFINGVLDKLVAELSGTKIKKTGRGLME